MYSLVPIGDCESIVDEIKITAKRLSSRFGRKELSCKVGPETKTRLPRRVLLDDGTTVSIKRETVIPGSFWSGIEEIPS